MLTTPLPTPCSTTFSQRNQSLDNHSRRNRFGTKSAAMSQFILACGSADSAPFTGKVMATCERWESCHL